MNELKMDKNKNYIIYNSTCLNMSQIKDKSIQLTITSPPYWNAIDYDIHANHENDETWYRNRDYKSFGGTYEEYLKNIEKVFKEVLRVTTSGGFCAIIIGTLLYKKKHYPIPMQITDIMLKLGWLFHQDIIWNKVTGGVRRAGSFIQRPYTGYYYPNIMTEYILIFRKEGKIRRGNTKTIEIDELFTKDIANSIWHIAPVPPQSIKHPCPFPEEIVRRLLLLYSQENDTILDPFIGSGQTAIASLRHKRKCIGYEIEMEYLKLAENRIQSFPSLREHNLINTLIPKFNKIYT